MNGGKRFRYALEPLLLTRRWDLDALLADLGDQNAAIKAGERVLGDLADRIRASGDDWKGYAANASVMQVDRFALLTRYLGDLASQERVAQTRLDQQLKTRDQLIERIAQAKRELDVVEKHRQGVALEFARSRMCVEYKAADDQWITLQSGSVQNGD